MHDYEIKKLSKQFYKDYPHDQYQEILTKEERSYDVVLFKIDYLADCYVCVPFSIEKNIIMDISLNFLIEVKSTYQD